MEGRRYDHRSKIFTNREQWDPEAKWNAWQLSYMRRHHRGRKVGSIGTDKCLWINLLVQNWERAIFIAFIVSCFIVSKIHWWRSYGRGMDSGYGKMEQENISSLRWKGSFTFSISITCLPFFLKHVFLPNFDCSSFSRIHITNCSIPNVCAFFFSRCSCFLLLMYSLTF